MSSEPQREVPRLHACVCQLRDENGMLNSCWAATPPDQAFCDECMESGHHLLPEVQEVLRERRWS